MTIKIVNETPDKSVVKQVVCKHCGVTLDYVPNDVITGTHYDYGGGSDNVYYIVCLNCKKDIYLR